MTRFGRIHRLGPSRMPGLVVAGLAGTLLANPASSLAQDRPPRPDRPSFGDRDDRSGGPERDVERGDRSGDRQRGDRRQQRGDQQRSWGMGGTGANFPSLGDIMRPDYMLRDVQVYASDLDLAEEQQVIVEQLFRDYDGRFADASDSLRKALENLTSDASDPDVQDPQMEARMEEVRDRMRSMHQEFRNMRESGEEMDREQMREQIRDRMGQIREDMTSIRREQFQSEAAQGSMEERSRLIRAFGSHRKAMAQEMRMNLVAVLTEPQVEALPKLERKLRRMQSLGRGRLAGESLDLFRMTRDLELDAETSRQVEVVLEVYDLDLDAALVARDAYLDESSFGLYDAMRTMDSAAGLRIVRQQSEMRCAVRDVNDRTLELVAQTLPEATSGEFHARAMREGYPRIFSPTRVQRAIDAAREIESLEEDILAAIGSLETSYGAELEVSNAALLYATREHEADGLVQRAERQAAWMTGSERQEAGDDPIRARTEDRQQLDERYLEQLESLLGTEQYASLPGTRRDFRRDWGSGGDRWGGGDRGSGGREAFMQQFDRNGDGRIDEGEREQIRDHFRGRDGGGGSSRPREL